jgi:hypothetical protein
MAAEDPPRRNTLRMGLPETPASDLPRAPHPANVAKAAPLRYVLLGDAPTRRREKQEKIVPEPDEDSDDPAVLFDQLSAHLGWLSEERRPELRRLLLRGDLERAIRRLDEEQARFPRNVSIEKCRKIVERALLRRVSQRLEPTDRIPVLTGEVSSTKPRDPRVLIADRINGIATIDEVLRSSPLPRLPSLLAFEELIDRGVVSFKSKSVRPPPVVVDDGLQDGPVSARITRADPIEVAAHAELSRALVTPAPAPAVNTPLTAPSPMSAEPGSALRNGEGSAPAARAPASTTPTTTALAVVTPMRPVAALAEVSLDTRPSATEVVSTRPDRSRRLVTALVGITGAAVGIAVVAILFASRAPEPTKTGSSSHPGGPPGATAQSGRSSPGPSNAPGSSAAVPPSQNIQLTIDASPRYARVYLDNQLMKTPYELTLARDGKDHEVRVEAPGHKTRKVPFKSSADLALVIALEPLPKKKNGSAPSAPPPPKDDDIY